MKVTDEHIFKKKGGSGFDIVLDASELGVPPGKEPPAKLSLTVPNGKEIEVELMGEVINAEGEFQYWSYFNEWPEEPVNLKVFND